MSTMISGALGRFKLALAGAGGPLLVAYMANGIGAVLRTVFDKLMETISVKDFGAISDGVADDSAAVAKANTRAGKRPLVFIGVSHIAVPTTITAPIADTMEQIFSETSQVTIDNGLPVRPEWFGMTRGNARRATNALPDVGGVVKFSIGRYPNQDFSYGIGATVGGYIGKQGVWWQGAEMPQMTMDCRGLVGGTIVEGMILAFASNFHISDMGADSGIDVVTAAGGVPMEGICLTYPDDASKAANALRLGARVHNVIGLGSGPLAPVHGVILGEGYKNVRHSGEIIGAMAQHGVVVKCQGVGGSGQLTGYCNGGEGVIIKSDTQSTAFSTHVQVGAVYSNANGPFGHEPFAVATTGSGLTFQCTGNNIGAVQIGSAMLIGHPICMRTIFEVSGQEIESVNIKQLVTDQYGVANAVAINLDSALLGGGAADGKIKSLTIGSATLKNGGRGILASFANTAATESHVTIGQLDVDTMTDVAVDIGRQSYLTIGNVQAQKCAGGIYRITGTPLLDVGTLSRNASGPLYSSANGGLVPQLLNGWAGIASEEDFNVGLIGGEKSLMGVVSYGSSNVVAQLPQWAWPSKPQRLTATGYNGATEMAVPVTIGADGVVTVNLIKGGIANCSDFLSFCGVRFR